MITNEALDFIRQQRAQGIADNDIKGALARSGWKPEDINEAFVAAAQPAAAPPPASPIAGGEKPLSVGSFIGTSWEIFKKRPWFLIGVWLLSTIGFFAVSGISSGITTSIGHGAQFISLVVNWIIQILYGMGLIAFFLKAHDDINAVSFKDLWHPRKFWSYVGAYALYIIAILVGYILLLVPGVIAMIAFFFAPYFVIDKGMGPIEAMKASARITKGNRLRLLALFGACGLLALLGFIALIVGILVVIPVVSLIYVNAYRRLSAAADAKMPRQKLTGGELTLVILGCLIPGAVAVIGLLASVVLVSLNSAREKGRDAIRFSDVKQLEIALTLYQDQNNSYPATLELLQPDFIAAVPTDPQTNQSFDYEPAADGKSYQLCTTYETSTSYDKCVSSDDGGVSPGATNTTDSTGTSASPLDTTPTL